MGDRIMPSQVRVLTSGCALVTAVLITGCGLLESDTDRTFEVELERDRYALYESDEVEARITNAFGRALYYSTCMLRSVQRLVDGKIVAERSPPVCECICIEQLAPGERVPAEFSAMSVRFMQGHWSEQELLNSSFRLRFHSLFTSPSGSDSVSVEVQQSPTFTFTNE